MGRVLVTGAAGFIGSNLVRRCLEEGWKVDSVDNLSNGHLQFVPVGHNTTVNDFASPQILNKIREARYDVVFHLAAVPRVGYSVEHPVSTNDVNVTRTLDLIEACKGNVKRFVFASSSSVYGGAEHLPVHESCPKNPRSPYALQKSIIEDYLKLYHELYGFESACLRFFNVFGPNQLGSSPYACAIGAWLTAIKRGEPMRSDGDGTQTRDMCYVDNVVDACVKAGKHSGLGFGGRQYNVACGDSTSNKEILEYLLTRYPAARFVNAPERVGDVKHTLADVSRAREDFGYVPIVRFWDGLEKTIKWYDDNWESVKGLTLKT